MEAAKADETRKQLLALVDALDGPFHDFKRDARELLLARDGQHVRPGGNPELLERWISYLRPFVGVAEGNLHQLYMESMPQPPRRIGRARMMELLEGVRAWLIREKGWPPETVVFYHQFQSVSIHETLSILVAHTERVQWIAPPGY